MTAAPRIIPCLDVANGRVVKGVQFQQLRDCGDPVEMAQRYEQQGADELVFLDISATHQDRATMLDVVEQTANVLFIPLTVGGGIRTVSDVRATLRAGADKVAMNSAALANPDLIRHASNHFGAQCVVVAIDAKRVGPNRWNCFSHGGRNDTGVDAMEWAQRAAKLGAGEILLTSMDHDGVQNGYDLALTKAVSSTVAIPVIASGGCGSLDHVCQALEQGDAALVASLFHDGAATVGDAKQAALDRGIAVRPPPPF